MGAGASAKCAGGTEKVRLSLVRWYTVRWGQYEERWGDAGCLDAGTEVHWAALQRWELQRLQGPATGTLRDRDVLCSEGDIVSLYTCARINAQ